MRIWYRIGNVVRKYNCTGKEAKQIVLRCQEGARIGFEKKGILHMGTSTPEGTVRIDSEVRLSVEGIPQKPPNLICAGCRSKELIPTEETCNSCDDLRHLFPNC